MITAAANRKRMLCGECGQVRTQCRCFAEPFVFDGVEYQWKTLGGLFRLYRKDLTEWPKLDVSSYQPKKKEKAKREAKHD